MCILVEGVGSRGASGLGKVGGVGGLENSKKGGGDNLCLSSWSLGIGIAWGMSMGV